MHPQEYVGKTVVAPRSYHPDDGVVLGQVLDVDVTGMATVQWADCKAPLHDHVKFLQLEEGTHNA
jgi:hypothetical protein